MHTLQKNVEVINGLIETSSSTTNNESTNLTDAVDRLVEACDDGYTDTILKYAIQPTAEGEQIFITDSMEYSALAGRVYGKLTQVTTGGNQLLKYPYADETSGLAGINVIVKDNGVIHISGASTQTGYYNIYTNTDDKRLPLEAGTYTLSRNTSSNDISILGRSKLSDGTNDASLTLRKNTSSVTFTIQEGGSIFLYIEIGAGVTCDEDVYLMLNKGSTALPWEPYTGGIASPNPDYPQTINSTRESGSIECAITEKNLCPINLLKKGWYGQGDVMGSPTTNDSYPDAVYGVPFKYEPGKTLAWNFGNLNGTDVRLRMVNSDGIIWNYVNDITATNGTVELIHDCPYIIPLFLQGVPDTCIITYSDTVPTEDKLQTLTLQTPNGLRGIPIANGADAIYTDENGQHWISDYIDLAQGKYVQRIVEVTIDGSEAVGWYADGPWHMSKNALFGTEIQLTGTYAMSDTFTMQNYNYICNGKNEKTMYYSTDGSTFTVNANVLFETQDAAGFKKFFSEHPTKIYAILKEPIETDLSEEEISQLINLTMNHPNTTILSDSNAHINMVYIADPELYIKNLTNSILTVGGGV